MTIERIDSIPSLSLRPQNSHKGMYGSILVLAGGRGMAGAAGLVGASALRSGAGLVRVASSAEVAPIVATFEPSYMTYPLPCDEEGLIRFPEALRGVEHCLKQADVLAVGPGLGQSEGLRQLLHWTIEEVTIPTVLDADALNNLDGRLELLETLNRPVVITPHPGEFARLIGKSTQEVQGDRENLAVSLAKAAHLVVVLKGAGTIVTDGTRVYVNSTGNPGMATGGSGDVLTGVIAALLGQKLPAFEAAQLGTYAHGLAGDIARAHTGTIGMIAGDIVDHLPDAFDQISEGDR